MEYPIVEVFRSIQGEGYHTGTPCVFVRLAGCPLHCPFCDTDKKIRYSWSPTVLVKKIREFWAPVPLIVVTGGEPTQYSLFELSYELKSAFECSIHIETNGFNMEEVKSFDWVSLSPKRSLLLAPETVADEVKWLVPEWSLNDIQRMWELAPFHFVQPVNYRTKINRDNLKLCLQMMEEEPRLRLSLQLHKVIGVR